MHSGLIVNPDKKVRLLVFVTGLLLTITVQAGTLEYLNRSIEHEGIRVHLRMEALEENAPPVPQAGQLVRLWLDGLRLADDQPLNNWRVGAWLDRETDIMSGTLPVCNQRISKYLSGNLIQRPLLDLTGYYVLSLDVEPSISVLDPSVSFSGRSSLYTAMHLEGPGFDWVKTSDDMRLYTAIPNEKKLAIADLQTLKVIDHISLSGQPTRLALQPDERLLWVGQIGVNREESAVSVVDTIHDTVVADMALAPGYHEFAFSADDRFTYVSSRQSQVLTIIDNGTLQVVRELDLGFEPLGLVYTGNPSLLWVTDAKAGRIHRYDREGNPVDYLVLKPGIESAKLSPDGRHMLILNSSQNLLHVLAAESGKEKHRLTISGQPYDVMFSEQFAYIRTLRNEQVGLLSLASLDSQQPILKSVPAGASALAVTTNLLRASSMALTLDRSGAFFVTPSERTLHHYMEGMNAPSAGLRTYGHTPMAAMVVQRGLRQVKPGQYSAVVRLPSAGRMVLALTSEAPALRECFGFLVEASSRPQPEESIDVQWISEGVQKVKEGTPLDFRLRVASGQQGSGKLKRLQLRIVSSAGGISEVLPLQQDPEKRDEWFVKGKLMNSGGYYIYVEGDKPLKSVYSTVLVDRD